MLVPWLDDGSLFSELDALRRQMDAMFERTSHERGQSERPGGLRLHEADDHYLLTLDVPGLRPEDVELTVSGGQLTLSASRDPSADPPEGARPRHRERRSWRFTRTLTLPEQVDADNVEATVKDGVLTVRLPTRPEVQPRRIEVQGA